MEADQDEEHSQAMEQSAALTGGAEIFARAVSQATSDSATPAQTGASSNEEKKGRKTPRFVSVDVDPLADILARLGLGDEGNGSTTVPESDTNNAVLVLVDVLQIDIRHAGFLLSSSDNDIVKAVNIHYELEAEVAAEPSTSGSKRPRQTNRTDSGQWRRRPVEIIGLPEGWEAFVSRSQGCVVFLHIESGHMQHEVPPGFADVEMQGTRTSDAEATPGSSSFQPIDV